MTENLNTVEKFSLYSLDDNARGLKFVCKVWCYFFKLQ